jgi:GTPase SAR1 family protein
MATRPIRVLVAGNLGVGKTTLCYRYQQGTVEPPFWGMPTCLEAFSVKILFLLDAPSQVYLQVWDLASIEDSLLGQFRNFLPSIFTDPPPADNSFTFDVLLLCFSLTDKASFADVTRVWSLAHKAKCPSVRLAFCPVHFFTQS